MRLFILKLKEMTYWYYTDSHIDSRNAAIFLS